MLLTFALQSSSVLHPSRLVPFRSIPFHLCAAHVIHHSLHYCAVPNCTVLRMLACRARDAYVFRFPVCRFWFAACRLPCAVYGLLFTVNHRLLRFTVYGCTVCGLLLAVYGLPVTIYIVRFTVYGFTMICGFRFLVHRFRFIFLPFTFYRLIFTVYGLRFAVCGVPFPADRFRFTVKDDECGEG